MNTLNIICTKNLCKTWKDTNTFEQRVYPHLGPDQVHWTEIT